MEYRFDVNGLRAIAVLAVMVFHFNEGVLPGGFAGVDVFFVISGFLMTKIIMSKVECNEFSISNFYFNRYKRIFPPLFSLSIFVFVVSFFGEHPYNLERSSLHVLSSLGFFSNFVYWLESGYFDVSSQSKVLLHTWSLSVEWQFYIIYPILIVLLNKVFSLQYIKYIIAITTIILFGGAVYASVVSPNAAYFLLPTRAWEMLLGGCVYLFPIGKHISNRKIICNVLLLLLLASFLYINKYMPWPGVFTLIPALTTFLIIQFSCDDNFISRNKYVQFLGRSSYSIYLWHWPIYIYLSPLLSGFYLLISCIVLSFIIGACSYLMIESRKVKHNLFGLFNFLLVAFIFLCVSSYVTHGFIERLSGEDKKIALNAIQAIGDWEYPSPNLVVGGNELRYIPASKPERKNILFIGASHIEQLYPYVVENIRDNNVYFLTQGGCFISASYVNPKWSCENIQNHSLLFDEISFDSVITSSFVLNAYLPDEGYLREKQLKQRVDELNQFIDYVLSTNSEFYLILGQPFGKEFDPKSVFTVDEKFKRYVDVETIRAKYLEQYNALKSTLDRDDIVVIDPIEYLCNELCLIADDESVFYYSDESHMRPWYARSVLSYLEPILK